MQYFIRMLKGLTMKYALYPILFLICGYINFRCDLNPDASNKQLVYKGFETGDFSEWVTTLELESFYSIDLKSNPYELANLCDKETAEEVYSHQIEASIVRGGQYSGRFEVRPGDRDLWNPDTIHVEVLDKYNAHIGENPSDIWYGWSVYLPGDFSGKTEDLRGIFSQFHAQKDERDILRSPNLAFRYTHGDGMVSITSRSSSEPYQSSNDGVEIIQASFTPIYGGWNDFIVQVKWTWTENGFLRIWFNENLIVDYQGPTAYNDELGPYFRCGLYQDMSELVYVNYCDEYRRGYSYNSVNPNR